MILEVGELEICLKAGDLLGLLKGIEKIDILIKRIVRHHFLTKLYLGLTIKKLLI